MVTVQDFETNYLVKDGMLGNEENLTKAPRQLKVEVGELKDLIDTVNAVVTENANLLNIVTGGTPEGFDLGAYPDGYPIGAYITYNTQTYKSLVDNNTEVPGTGSNWELVTATAATVDINIGSY